MELGGFGQLMLSQNTSPNGATFSPCVICRCSGTRSHYVSHLVFGTNAESLGCSSSQLRKSKHLVDRITQLRRQSAESFFGPLAGCVLGSSLLVLVNETTVGSRGPTSDTDAPALKTYPLVLIPVAQREVQRLRRSRIGSQMPAY